MYRSKGQMLEYMQYMKSGWVGEMLSKKDNAD